MYVSPVNGLPVSSNFCELEIALESDIGTGISIYHNFTNFFIFMTIQQPFITPICIKQSRTGRLTNNTAYILCNSYINITDFECKLMSVILHKGSSTNSGQYIFTVKSTVIHLNETMEGTTCLISKTYILQNISQLMLDFINCHENA